MDNLESQTYEVFEKDPIKYSQYQQVRADTQRLSHLSQVNIQCNFLSFRSFWFGL